MIIFTVLSSIVDDAAARCVRTTMCKHIEHGSIQHVFDMRELSELDTRTMATLIRALRLVREVGGSISLVAENPNVLNTLSTTALDRVFGVYTNDADAIAAFETIRFVSA